MGEVSSRNPGLAAVFSFIFSGLGQIYNGQLLKGLFIIFISGVNLLFFILGAICVGLYLVDKRILPAQALLGGVLLITSLTFIFILGIYSIWDAYNVAQKNGS